MRPGRSIPATGQPVGEEPQKGAPTVRVCTPQLHTRTGASFDFERHRSVVRSDDLRQPSARVQPSNTAMPSGGVTFRHAAWPRAGSSGRVHRSTTGLFRRDAPSCKPASGSSSGCRSWPGYLFSGRPRAVEIAGEAPKDGAAKSSRCLPRRSQTAGATTDTGIPRDRRRTTPRTRPAKVRGKSHQLLPRLPCQPPHRSSR